MLGQSSYRTDALDTTYHSDFTSDGFFLTEWRLITRDGQYENSSALAEQVFGAVPDGGIPLAGPGLVVDGNGMYFDFVIPPGGTETRHGVFMGWGGDVPGYSRYALMPANSTGQMTIGITNFYDETSDFISRYDSAAGRPA